MDLGLSMRVQIQSDSSTAKSVTDRLGADTRTNTSTRYLKNVSKNEYKAEISASSKVPKGNIVQMLRRCQSLLPHFNRIANLQDWYSADHGSHTPQ